MGYNRSVSQLKSVTRCAEAYKLERLEKKPQTPAAWTALGIALHEAFCEWEKSDRQIDVCEHFEKSYDECIAEMKVKQPNLDLWMRPPVTKSTLKSIESYRKRGLEKDVPLYRDRCLEAEWEIYRLPSGEKALELEFEVDIGGITVRGAVDRVQWWPTRGYAAQEDLKSGNVDEWDARQLGTYSYALGVAYGIPLKWGRYWFTKLDRPGAWIDLSRYTESYLTDTYRSLDTIISSGLFLPNPGKHCDLCGVKPYCREMGNQ